MKIILIGPDLEENLALSYLSSALENSRHRCEIIPFNGIHDYKSVVKRTLRINPDLIGFSLVAQFRYHEYQKIIDSIRKDGFGGHITAGGHFASLRAVQILDDTPGLDSIIHHDGENRIVQLANSLSTSGKIPDHLDGISFRTVDGKILCRKPVEVPDINSLSFPTRRKPDKTLGFPKAPIVTSRGCSGSCSFCSIHAWHRQVPKNRLRYRTASSITEEMIDLHHRFGVRVFVFHDDDFIHPVKEQAINRFQKIFNPVHKEIRDRFAYVIKCRPDDVEEDLFRYLKSMGLARVYIGIESHAQSGLSALNRKITPDINIRALKILSNLDIYSCFNLLIFHPDTTVEELQENIEFLMKQIDHPFDIARTELYACSDLEQRMIREKRAIGDYRGYDYRISDPHVEKIFQHFVSLLGDRHFGKSPIVQHAQDLGFRLSLLKHIHPSLVSKDIDDRVSRLIREINFDTVYFLKKICDFVLNNEAIDKFLSKQIQNNIEKRLKQQRRKLVTLSLELESRALIARSRFTGRIVVKNTPRVLSRIAALAPPITFLVGHLAGCDITKPVVCDPAPEPIFSTKVEPELDRTCAISGCHVGNLPKAGLNLKGGFSYSNLVQVPSTQVPDKNRVEPYNVLESYLVNKMEGTQNAVGGSGEQMPKDGDPNLDLTENLKRWIEDGAQEK